MVLKIEGSDKRIERLSKELRIRVKRDGLKMSIVKAAKKAPKEVEKPKKAAVKKPKDK